MKISGRYSLTDSEVYIPFACVKVVVVKSCRGKGRESREGKPGRIE